MTTTHFLRYQTDIIDIFSEEKELELQLQVERALAKINAKYGKIPVEAAAEIESYVNPDFVKLKRVKEIESEVHHDLFSMVLASTEVCPRYGEYIHLGATSSDIKDTVLGIQLKEAKLQLLERIKTLEKTLIDLATTHKNLICIGRTHGQHAIPITYGFKFANYLSQISICKIDILTKEVAYGKMSGAVGTYAAIGSFDLEKDVLQELNLTNLPATTQIIPRIVHFQFLSSLLALTGVIESIAKEIRNLQRTEIGELAEPFSIEQIGSSAMPQKRNPWRCERICGISRYLRQLLAAIHENISLEHERDMSNSSTERIIIPQIISLTDFIIKESVDILTGLEFNKKQIKINLNRLEGRQCAENLLNQLTLKKGRQKAHKLLRKLTQEENFLVAVLADPEVTLHFSNEKIKEILDPNNYLGLTQDVVERVLSKYKEED